MIELTRNEMIADYSRVVVLWTEIADYELLIERLAIAYKKYRSLFGYPRDYFEEPVGHLKTMWNTSTPKVFELLVETMGWNYIFQLDKEVFEERKAEEGLFGADLAVYTEYMYANVSKSFSITDEARNADLFSFGFKLNLPVNIKRIAYKVAETWHRLKTNEQPKPVDFNKPLLMKPYNANERPLNDEFLTGKFHEYTPIYIAGAIVHYDLNNCTCFMQRTGTTPTEICYDAIIEGYLSMEMSHRCFLLNGEVDLWNHTTYKVLPQPELRAETQFPRLVRKITYTPAIGENLFYAY